MGSACAEDKSHGTFGAQDITTWHFRVAKADGKICGPALGWSNRALSGRAGTTPRYRVLFPKNVACVW